jgi:hypothetical protein
MADRRRAAGKNENKVPPEETPPTVAEVLAMLASVVAATARVEGKLDRVLAEFASLPRTVGHEALRGPVASHPLRDRLPCRGHRPRPRKARQCAHYRRDH